MLRVWAIVIVAYAYGYSGFEKIRPEFIDQPIASFHTEMNAAVLQVVQKTQVAAAQFMIYADRSAERAKREFGVASAVAEEKNSAGLAAANGRHRDTRSAAGTGVRFGTGAERQILVHTDTDFAEPATVAGDRNHVGCEPRIGFDESLLDFFRRHHDVVVDTRKACGNF